jgi:PAS domain S-box-containing protein
MKGNHNDERDLRFAYFTVEQASEAILWHGEDGRFAWANEAACRHFGYSREELLTLAVYDINPDYQEERWRKFWDKLSKVKKLDVEGRHRRKDGHIIPVEVSTNLIDFEGEKYTCSFVRDISERKQAEEEKAQAFEEIQRLRKQLELENEYLNEEVLKLQTYGDIVGNSHVLQNIMKQIEMVAPTDAGVIIFGESGTGKELVAREIHRRSARRLHSMIKVNCASIPRELYESEFFGHVKGAFTGAVKDRIGRFELANGGTLFLDEVGEIPLELQSKLLRVLQEGTYERVGSEKTQKIDVRIIAATNRDLKREVEKGRFREDLYYRLNVFPVEILPLRNRKADIPALALHFMELAAKKFNYPLRQLSRANILQLQSYDWPGNVRELQNVIERAVISSRSSTLRFNLPVGENLISSPTTAAKAESSEGRREIMTEEEMKRLERENIVAALERTHWKIFGAGGAAELLDMRPTTLASRMKKMGLKKPK